MSTIDPAAAAQLREALEHVVFVGFNSRVAALNRYNGEVLWSWVSPKGTSDYVAVLLDADRLIVSVQGYTYCLNPLNGKELWSNPLKGFGTGLPTIVSVNGSCSGGGAAESIRQEEARRQSAS
jgi:outer membrane protein assembly factor BamB